MERGWKEMFLFYFIFESLLESADSKHEDDDELFCCFVFVVEKT